MIEFSRGIGNGSLRQLAKLILYDNQIGDAGMIAFAEALKPTDNFPMGSLRHLTELHFAFNQISDTGMVSFASLPQPQPHWRCWNDRTFPRDRQRVHGGSECCVGVWESGSHESGENCM